MSTATAASAAPSMDPSQRRLAGGLLISVLLHGLLLSLQFGIPGLRPGPGRPLTVRLAPPAPLALETAVAPQPPLPPLPPAPAPVPVAPLPAVPVPPVPVAQTLPSIPPVPPPRTRAGFTLVDPVVPAPVPVAPPPAPAPAPRRPARRRIRPDRKVADGLHTRVIAQDAHEDTTFHVPLPEIEAQAATEEQAGDAAPLLAEQNQAGERERQDETAEAPERLAAQRRIELESREREARREADEAALRTAAEATARAEAERHQARLAQESAQYEEELARGQRQAEEERQRRQAEEARLRAQRDEEERLLAAARQREADAVRQLAERQRAEEAERQLAAERRLDEQARQQLAEQRRVEQAEQERARQLAQQRQAEEAARRLVEQRAAEDRQREELARQDAQQRAEQLARQQAEEGARRQREQAGADVFAGVHGPAAAGDGGSGSRDGGGRGAGALPRGALGSDLANRARELVRGIDIAKPPPQVMRPAEEAVRAVRRALAEAARHDVPLRLYIDSVRQKIERNAVLSEGQLQGGAMRGDPVVSVAIRSDGSVEDVTIVRSSGRPDIDEIVRRIVRLNARYAAFPPNVAAHYDVVELRRVWNFSGVLRLLEEMR